MYQEIKIQQRISHLIIEQQLYAFLTKSLYICPFNLELEICNCLYVTGI